MPKLYIAGQGCTLIDVLPKAKTIWPEIGEGTRVISTEADTITIPIFNSLAVEWRAGNESWKPERELIGWFDKPTECAFFWRVLGRMFNSEKIYHLGQFPRYKRLNPLFGQVTIQLQHHDGLDFAKGYDAVHDILAVKIR